MIATTDDDKASLRASPGFGRKMKGVVGQIFIFNFVWREAWPWWLIGQTPLGNILWMCEC